MLRGVPGGTLGREKDVGEDGGHVGKEGTLVSDNDNVSALFTGRACSPTVRY